MDYEKSYEEIKDYVIYNSEPKYVFDGYDDFYGNIIWSFNGFKYTEYLQVIVNEDGEDYSIEESGFFDTFSLEKLKQIFIDFPNSGFTSFEEYFEKETGCSTHPVDCDEYSVLNYGDSTVLFWSQEVSEDSEDELEEMYEAFQKIKNHDALQSELSVKGSKKKISKI